MNIFFLIISFLFGSIIGSFLNVVALRYGTNKDLGGRSKCMSCATTLSWYELLPVFSYAALLGKCKTCKSKISCQYFLVEILTGILFASLFYILKDILFVLPILFIILFGFYAFVFSVLVVILAYDAKHKIIPDGLALLFAILALVKIVTEFGFTGIFKMPGIIDLLAGPALAIPFAALWAISGGRWIGLGDAKLALGIGWFLGFAGGLSAVALGFWLGAIWSLIILMLSKTKKIKTKLTRTTEIPFAPFLIFGLLIIFFFHFDFFYLKDILSYAI